MLLSSLCPGRNWHSERMQILVCFAIQNLDSSYVPWCLHPPPVMFLTSFCPNKFYMFTNAFNYLFSAGSSTESFAFCQNLRFTLSINIRLCIENHLLRKGWQKCESLDAKGRWERGRCPCQEDSTNDGGCHLPLFTQDQLTTGAYANLCFHGHWP